MQTIKAVVSSILSPSSTANEQQGSSDPHNGNTPAQQVKEDQQLSEATRDLSLEDKSTRESSSRPAGEQREGQQLTLLEQRVKKALALELQDSLVMSRDM